MVYNSTPILTEELSMWDISGDVCVVVESGHAVPPSGVATTAL